jgi:acyl carrier protein
MLALKFATHFSMTRSGFRAVLEDILSVPRGSLMDADSRDTVEAWSSLADAQILASITSEFGLEPEAELLEAETVGELLNLLEQRRVLSG